MKKILLVLIAILGYYIQFKIIWSFSNNIKQLTKEINDLRKENNELFDKLSITSIDEEDI